MVHLGPDRFPILGADRGQMKRLETCPERGTSGYSDREKEPCDQERD